jgi:hypothetical protein
MVSPGLFYGARVRELPVYLCAGLAWCIVPGMTLLGCIGSLAQTAALLRANPDKLRQLLEARTQQRFAQSPGWLQERLRPGRSHAGDDAGNSADWLYARYQALAAGHEPERQIGAWYDWLPLVATWVFGMAAVACATLPAGAWNASIGIAVKAGVAIFSVPYWLYLAGVMLAWGVLLAVLTWHWAGTTYALCNGCIVLQCVLQGAAARPAGEPAAATPA